MARRFARERLAGLESRRRRGQKPKYTTAANKRILTLLDQPPPSGYARWTGPLLAAGFEVATGKVKHAHKTRRWRVEFLDFMNESSPPYPGKDLHVVLDNPNTHKPKNDRWLKRHPNVQFRFTPTRASWLNQVEIWFSILEGKSLRGASFTSVNHLKKHIDAFIEAHNQDANPSSGPKPRRIGVAS